MKAAPRTDGRCSSTVDPIHVYRSRIGPDSDPATRERGMRIGLLALSMFPDIHRIELDEPRQLAERWLAGDEAERATLAVRMEKAAAGGGDATRRLCGIVGHAEPGRAAAAAIQAVTSEGKAVAQFFVPAFERACEAAGFKRIGDPDDWR